MACWYYNKQPLILLDYVFTAQNIDYERFFAKKGAELADPGGVDYRNLAPLPEKRFSTGVPITVPPVAIANPVFGGKLVLFQFIEDLAVQVVAWPMVCV